MNPREGDEGWEEYTDVLADRYREQRQEEEREAKRAAKWSVIQVTVDSEDHVLEYDTCIEACEAAMGWNRHPFNTLYIVEWPDGYRMPMVEQREYIYRLTGYTFTHKET